MVTLGYVWENCHAFETEQSLRPTLSGAIQMSDSALSDAIPVIARWQLVVNGSSILVTWTELVHSTLGEPNSCDFVMDA